MKIKTVEENGKTKIKIEESGHIKKLTFITEEQSQAIYDLENEWEEMLDNISQKQFDFNKFKSTFVNSVKLLAEYLLDDEYIPFEIVCLIMKIKEFSSIPEINKESLAGKLLTFYLSQVDNLGNMESEFETDRLCLNVYGYSRPIKIYIDDFDLTELMSDLNYTEE